jgi:hypothetical protein
MSHYPEVVEKIVQDYLQRVGIQLKRFPNSDQEEVLKELGSHIYKSYCCESDSEPVARILEVLRRLGEPADVVAEKLQELVAQGFIQVNGRISQFFDLLPPAAQRALLVFLFMAIAGAGLAMLWLSIMLKGLRFLFDLILDRGENAIQKAAPPCARLGQRISCAGQNTLRFNFNVQNQMN